MSEQELKNCVKLGLLAEYYLNTINNKVSKIFLQDWKDAKSAATNLSDIATELLDVCKVDITKQLDRLHYYIDVKDSIAAGVAVFSVEKAIIKQGKPTSPV